MKKRDISDYLQDILDNLMIIEEFTFDLTFEDFFKDKKTIYAVNHAIEIIGEATKKIPNEIRSQYPQIPWQNVAGMRDILIHKYFGINLQIVWDTVKQDLPLLKPVIQDILAKVKG